FLNAYRKFGQFRGASEAELAGWLRQILAHSLGALARRYLQAQGRRATRERSLERLLEHSSQALERILATEESSPSAAAERRDLAVVLADVLAELSAEQREVVVLHYLEGLDWDEVAKRMGRTRGAVRMLRLRALQRLRPLVEARLAPGSEGH